MISYLWDNLFRRSKEKSIRQQLGDNFLFQDLSFQELKWLENIVNVRVYRTGESVFRQGDLGVGMYIIAKGSVDIFVEEAAPTTGELINHQVTQLKEGDFFGDLALIENDSRRTASATAHVESVLIGFFKPELIEITERNPTAGVKILFRLSEILGIRLKETTQKLSELKKVSPKGIV